MEFNELNFTEIDKDLTPEERDEWQAIYASYRSGSVMSGNPVSIDYHDFSYTASGGETVKESMRCAIIILFTYVIIEKIYCYYQPLICLLCIFPHSLQE